MDLDELLRLDEHAAGATAGVIDLPVVRGQYDNSGFDYARQRVELASLFAFSAGERGALSVVTAGTMATTRHYCRTE
jgi:hypothetical protein